MSTGLNQQSLFNLDTFACPSCGRKKHVSNLVGGPDSICLDCEHQGERERREKAHTERAREEELGADESDVADYMRRKDRQEEREKRRNNDMHAQAVQQADKVALFRWAISADDPDLDDEATREAHQAKARLKALAEAQAQTCGPATPGFIGLRDMQPDRWPFDDDLEKIPSTETSQADYEAYLADQWATRWRHVIPTDVLEDSQGEAPSFL